MPRFAGNHFFTWQSPAYASAQYVERFGLDGNLTGGTLLIERAQLRSDSPDAPDIRLEVNIRFMFNAHGDLVVEDVVYTYNCIN